MNHIYGYPHSKEAEFYKLLLDYDESLERDLVDCKSIWYESGTNNLMVGDYGMSDRIEAVVISKKFGFIERLVKNDKIDLKEFHRLCGIINQDSEYWNGTPQDYEQVIMYLSISDTPIDDLVSILKE